MLHVCPQCGRYAEILRFKQDGSATLCPFCGYQTPIRRYPLFLITGASCAGKSTVTRELFLHDRRVVALESDILWDEKWRERDDNFRAYRAMWLRVSQNVSQQAEKPVVLCGCCDPSQFAGQPEAGFFSGLHYLAIVCRDEILRERMNRRQSLDPVFRKGNAAFNQWFFQNYQKTDPPITLLDTSDLSPQQAAESVQQWIGEILQKEMPHER